MKKLLLLLLLTASALAQNGRYDNIAIGPKGVIPFATISVCTQPANVANPPCTPLASLCSSLTDATCTQPNPITADELGNFHFYAKFATEPYTILIYGPRVAAPYGIQDILLAGGGGGGGVNAGTPFQVTRYNSLGTNIENSTGSDNPANGPTEWVSGLSVESAFLGVKTPNSPNGTVLNLLVCADPSVSTMTQAFTCPVSTTQAYAVADNGAGVTGNVVGARLGLHSVIFDNQTSVNHCAVPSATVPGQATDAGTSCPAGQEQIGRITTANSGAGTASQVDLRAWDVVNSASTGSVSTCATANSNALFAVAGNSVSCDALVTDDSNGNMTMKSLGLTDTSQAGFFYQKQGTAPTLSALNSVYVHPPTSVATTIGLVWPGTLPTTGNCVQWGAVGGERQFTDAGAPCGTGSAITIQTNSVNNTSQTAINFTDDVGPMGDTTNFTNPATSTEKLTVTPQRMTTPSAPTLTVNGTTGATTYCYKVVAWEDIGAAGSYHTPASGQTCATNGNATLSSTNSITLSGYSVFGARGYGIYRTSGGATQGLIGINTGKQFIDSGLTGDSSTAPTTNNTELFSSPLWSCASPFMAPAGVDALPCSPNAVNDEFTQTQGVIGDTNNPQWTAVNTGTNSFAATWTNGMLEMTSASHGAAGTYSAHCYFQSITSTPASYVALIYANSDTTTASGNWFYSIAFRESGTAKLITFGIQIQNTSTSRISVDHWTTATTSPPTNVKAAVFTNGHDFAPVNFKLQYDGANLNYFTSPDGVIYLQQYTEAKNAFFTTAPDQVGLCLSNNLGANVIDVDYFRRTQ